MRTVLPILAAAFALAAPSQAQIALKGPGTYLQDFDSLTGSAVPEPWVDATTLPGWYAQQSVSPEHSTRHNTIIGGDGSSSNGRIYSFGVKGGHDRALGGIPSGSVGILMLGVQFRNESPAEIVLRKISFDAKQWRTGGGKPLSMTAWYRIASEPMTDLDPKGLAEEDWTPLPKLEFITPVLEETGGRPVEPAGSTLSDDLNLSLHPGEYIMFRWKLVPVPGHIYHALSIDNFKLEYATPDK